MRDSHHRGHVGRFRSRFRATALGALAVIASGVLAAACDDGPVTPRPPETATLSGEVRTTEGAPLPAVPVRLTSPGGTVSSATTDDAGRYSFTGLQPGSYRLAVTVPLGFATPDERTVALSGDATLDIPVAAVRDAEETVAPGGTDTVAVSSGTFVIVQAPPGGGAVTVRLEEVAGTGFGDLDVVGTPVMLTAATAASPAPSSARGPRFAVAGTGTPVPVTVVQTVPTCDGGSVGMAFQVDDEAGGEPLFLFAESSCTTWTDPRTGRSGSAVSGSAEVPAGSRLPLAAFLRDVQCTTGSARQMTLHPRSADTPDRIPLVLIHGWQWNKLTCASFESFDPADETFGGVLDDLFANDEVASRYAVHILRYPTFQRVAVASDFLNQQIEARGWDARGVVLVGHSMGGLVGRGYLAAHGGDAVRALITLGTPHEGSPLADVLTVPSSCGSGLASFGIFSPTDGSADLSPDGPFITVLRDRSEHGTRILTIGGDISDDPAPGIVMKWARCIVRGMLEAEGATDLRNDGIVPLASALPSWTGVQHRLAGEDHLELTGGPAAERAVFMLGEIARCLPGTAPAAPSSNDFPLSGTLARQSDGRIDVVLNPVVVDGTPATGLTKDNFAIVENNCLKYFDVTTDEGNVGVDLVFVQDLSGSMSGAITGVRNSVIAFAADLRDRGLNVRLGAVGFSGSGGIETHPGAGSCESIGPVLDLSSPDAFLSHVQASWRASGGCDGPENALEAIEYAHHEMEWREGAARAYILITDISMHHAGTSCNGVGPCTDQTIASIVALVGGTSTIHAVAPSSAFTRTSGGGADPWALAEQTGGGRLVLPSGGAVDLNALGISERIADVVRLTFTSTTDLRAMHRLRIRVTVDGKVAEIAPGLVSYDVHPTLQRTRRR